MSMGMSSIVILDSDDVGLMVRSVFSMFFTMPTWSFWSLSPFPRKTNNILNIRGLGVSNVLLHYEVKL